MKSIALLGATGSIGTQTLDVARATGVRVLGISAHRQWRLLSEQAREFHPRWVVLADDSLAGELSSNGHTEAIPWRFGEAGIEAMVTDPEVDMVVSAIVGAAGLRGTLRAIEAGKAIALANKETLVVGGPLVTQLARARKCPLLPVDSEHSAIFQCLRAGREREVERIILTASGGPFRTRPLDDFDSITPEDALRHPTWNMGRKITIDSATMMNKALEIIEAHWLFGLPAERIAVVIHPTSVIHSMVEFVDGSVLAQASPPDMRLPIQYAITYPERLDGPTTRMDWSRHHVWEFEPPDPARYPALDLGFEVVRRGGTAGAALNAANEVAVDRFFSGEIRFSQIVRLVREVLGGHPYQSQPGLEDLLAVDRWARQEAQCWN